MKEIWKDIPGYEGYYQVSNYGRIYSMQRVIEGGKSGSTKIIKGKYLKLNEVHGYQHVTLCKNGRKERRKVHHLVMESFVGVRPSGLVTNHKNGIRNDNRATNLEYVTISENLWHAISVLGVSLYNETRFKPGMYCGESNPKSKLTNDSVLFIRKAHEEGVSTKDLLNELLNNFGVSVSRSTVNRIISGKSWNNI